MVKHITLWKLKDFALGNDKATNFELSKQQTLELQKDFPKLRSVEIGRGFKSGPNDYDICKILTFDSKEDLEEFLASPIHQKAHAFNKEIRGERAVIDYVVED
ncbi:MAG: Dabb family protein [Lachnospiraceae bacterium]|nr:Dabb family protein [Lachnospiraceae bacterium]